MYGGDVMAMSIPDALNEVASLPIQLNLAGSPMQSLDISVITSK